MSEDRWFKKCLENRDTIEELTAKNTKMRAALLLIAEHKQPYKNFSLNYGSKGMEDHFIAIAKEAL